MRPRSEGCAFWPGIARQIARSGYFLLMRAEASTLAGLDHPVALRGCTTGGSWRARAADRDPVRRALERSLWDVLRECCRRTAGDPGSAGIRRPCRECDRRSNCTAHRGFRHCPTRGPSCDRGLACREGGAVMTIFRLVGGTDVQPSAAPTTPRDAPASCQTSFRMIDDRPSTETLSTTAKNGGCARSARRSGEWPRRRHGIGDRD